MKDNLSLSIAIPTFNRFSELKNTIEILIPQLNENIEIVIVDNASDVDIKKYFTNNGLLKNNIEQFYSSYFYNKHKLVNGSKSRNIYK